MEELVELEEMVEQLGMEELVELEFECFLCSFMRVGVDM